MVFRVEYQRCGVIGRWVAVAVVDVGRVLVIRVEGLSSAPKRRWIARGVVIEGIVVATISRGLFLNQLVLIIIGIGSLAAVCRHLRHSRGYGGSVADAVIYHAAEVR